jgi:hypothetical protein
VRTYKRRFHHQATLKAPIIKPPDEKQSILTTQLRFRTRDAAIIRSGPSGSGLERASLVPDQADFISHVVAADFHVVNAHFLVRG